ncbi:hypothetical protein SDC9_168562 [bioreactor metagenome]|uniref:Uncharacterized protein n=1 Tax=bioreactor metagenome TaxID=1076179 RepID=A0A645GBC2_9ZZZZ
MKKLLKTIILEAKLNEKDQINATPKSLYDNEELVAKIYKALDDYYSQLTPSERIEVYDFFEKVNGSAHSYFEHEFEFDPSDVFIHKSLKYFYKNNVIYLIKLFLSEENSIEDMFEFLDKLCTNGFEWRNVDQIYDDQIHYFFDDHIKKVKQVIIHNKN